MAFGFAMCSKPGKNALIPIIIKSDLETIEIDGDKTFFTTNLSDVQIMNGNFQTDEFAFSGKHSVRLDSANLYGLNLTLKDLEEGEFIQASVWQKKNKRSDGALIASIKGKDYDHKFRTYYNKFSEGKSGWIKHNLSFIVTKGVEQIDFFVFAGKMLTYFDDFEIKRFSSAPKNELSKKLSLTFPESSKTKLDGFISNALKSEIIPSSDKKYVKAYILDGQDSIKIKVKLKGDWTDHIKSGKTSYRIKIGGNNAFDGLKTFSIQHPKTRNYIHEWILHKVAEIEDVLTTGYDFVSVDINGFSYGVYALEEHFDKQLLERRNRREGPIIKFDESGVWALNYLARKQDMKKGNFPYFESSIVDVFKQKRTLKSSVLQQSFDEGQVLLNLFKNGHLAIEDIFDLDQLAKFYVLMELSSHTHGLAWHNRRFYYNPVNQKLEHILYDALPHAIHGDYKSIVKSNLLGGKDSKELNFDNAVILSRAFKTRYLHYLELKTRPAYLDSIFEIITADLKTNLAAIHLEEPLYNFDKTEYYNNAAYLRADIPELDSIWEDKISTIKSVEYWFRQDKYKPRDDAFFVPEISLNAYLTMVDSLVYKIEVENFHLNDITLEGYTIKGGTSPVAFETPLLIKGYNGTPDKISVMLTEKPKALQFKVSNVPNTIITKKVIPWPKPRNATSRMVLESQFNPNSRWFSIKENKIVFKGKQVIDQLVCIPDNYEVEILSGSTIEFRNGGGLIVSNSFYAVGSSAAPISIFCNDSSSNGITVLKGESVIIKHAVFKGLSSLNSGKWTLTGAVTIYETPTVIENVSIIGNHCEDALNIIRSQFEIDSLMISDTYSDGFDADFCTGIIKNSSFNNTGNDCIDFSGSEIEISNIKIKNSGDKGISGGERSSLTLFNINIDKAVTGIASKDDSKIKGENISISNAEFGYAAFQKKGEYAPALIELTACEHVNLTAMILVELGSMISVNSEIYKGSVKLNIDELYARFNK